VNEERNNVSEWSDISNIHFLIAPLVSSNFSDSEPTNLLFLRNDVYLAEKQHIPIV
jgi:hypothetical protein